MITNLFINLKLDYCFPNITNLLPLILLLNIFSGQNVFSCDIMILWQRFSQIAIFISLLSLFIKVSKFQLIISFSNKVHTWSSRSIYTIIINLSFPYFVPSLEFSVNVSSAYITILAVGYNGILKIFVSLTWKFCLYTLFFVCFSLFGFN